LHRAFTVLFWASLPLWLILTFGALSGSSGSAQVADLDFNASAFVVMFTIGATYNITYAPIVSDYTRYLPVNVSSRALILTVYWGAAIAAIWMMALGAWLGAHFGVTDTFVGVHDATNAVIPWAGTALVIISGLALVATMGLNTYSATLTVLTAIDCFVPAFSTPRRRAITAVVLGAASTAIGVWVVHDISAAINNALLIMLYLLAPWTAINLVDYFVVRRGHYDVADILNPEGVYGLWAWRGLTAYGLGVASEIPFVTLTFYHGPIARALGGIDIAFAVSLAVAGIAFFLLTKCPNVIRDIESRPTPLGAHPRPHAAPVSTAKENTR
jgi:purine-cytosine permease-like protein